MNMDALYKLTHGIYILGSRDGDRPVGSVVDAVMQVANKPWILAAAGAKRRTGSCDCDTGESGAYEPGKNRGDCGKFRGEQTGSRQSEILCRQRKNPQRTFAVMAGGSVGGGRLYDKQSDPFCAYLVSLP